MFTLLSLDYVTLVGGGGRGARGWGGGIHLFSPEQKTLVIDIYIWSRITWKKNGLERCQDFLELVHLKRGWELPLLWYFGTLVPR